MSVHSALSSYKPYLLKWTGRINACRVVSHHGDLFIGAKSPFSLIPLTYVVLWVRGPLARIRRCITGNYHVSYQHTMRTGWKPSLPVQWDDQCAASFSWQQCELPAMNESGSKQPSERTYSDTLTSTWQSSCWENIKCTIHPDYATTIPPRVHQ